MTGLLSQIAGFANRFGDQLINPTSGLGKAAMWLNAASGNDLGKAQFAAHEDALKSQDSNLDRLYKQAQIAHLGQPDLSGTYGNYQLILSRLGQDTANNYLQNLAEGPPFAVDVQTAPGGPVVRQIMPRSQFAQPQSSTPKPGDVIDGFRYKGGNLNDKNSWEPAGGAGANPQPFR